MLLVGCATFIFFWFVLERADEASSGCARKEKNAVKSDICGDIEVPLNLCVCLPRFTERLLVDLGVIAVSIGADEVHFRRPTPCS